MTTTTQRGGTFRVVAGQHVDDGPEACKCRNCLKDPDYEAGQRQRSRTHVYRARQVSDPQHYDNDVVESATDLVARFNGNGHPAYQKFERVHATGTAAAAPPAPAELPSIDLAKLTVAQLLLVAEDEEIDLKGTSRKEDIVKTIQATRASRGQQ